MAEELSLPDAVLAIRAGQEMRGRGPIDLTLELPRAAALLGVIQLALRHPRFGTTMGPGAAARQAALEIAATLQEQLSECGPATTEILLRGWGPA